MNTTAQASNPFSLLAHHYTYSSMLDNTPPDAAPGSCTLLYRTLLVCTLSHRAAN